MTGDEVPNLVAAFDDETKDSKWSIATLGPCSRFVSLVYDKLQVHLVAHMAEMIASFGDFTSRIADTTTPIARCFERTVCGEIDNSDMIQTMNQFMQIARCAQELLLPRLRARPGGSPVMIEAPAGAAGDCMDLQFVVCLPQLLKLAQAVADLVNRIGTTPKATDDHAQGHVTVDSLRGLVGKVFLGDGSLQRVLGWHQEVLILKKEDLPEVASTRLSQLCDAGPMVAMASVSKLLGDLKKCADDNHKGMQQLLTDHHEAILCTKS